MNPEGWISFASYPFVKILDKGSVRKNFEALEFLVFHAKPEHSSETVKVKIPVEMYIFFYIIGVHGQLMCTSTNLSDQSQHSLAGAQLKSGESPVCTHPTRVDSTRRF